MASWLPWLIIFRLAGFRLFPRPTELGGPSCVEDGSAIFSCRQIGPGQHHGAKPWAWPEGLDFPNYHLAAIYSPSVCAILAWAMEKSIVAWFAGAGRGRNWLRAPSINKKFAL